MYLLHKRLELLRKALRLVELLLCYLSALKHFLHFLLRVSLKRAFKLLKALHELLKLRINSAAESLKQRITHYLPPSA